MKDREELLKAYNVLVAFQLWRRGAIEGDFTDNEKTIGEAIDTACGALWCIVNGESWMTLEKRLEIAESALKSCEAANDDLQKRLKEAESCSDSLHKLLKNVAAERDQAKKELADLWKQCRDVLGEDADADPHV